MKKFFKFIESPIRYLLIGFLFFTITNQLTDTTGMFIPVKQVKEDKECIVENNLKYLGAPSSQVTELSEAVKLASYSTNIKEELIIAIIKTESDFKKKAVSSKNYKGLMQTPTATFIYADVDILHGVRILQDKLRITDGNLLKALTLYKGGNNSEARKYAIQTLDLYEDLLEKNRKDNNKT